MKNRLTSNLLFGLAAASFFAVSAFAQEAAPAAAEAPAAAPAAEAPAAAPAEQAAPAPAQEAPAAAPAQETPVAAAPAEEKNAESAPAENTNPGEVADAAGNALDMLKASMNEGTSEAQMEVKYNGEVEFDAYTGNVWAEDDLNHSYASTFDLNFEVKFNEKWSAFVGLEADGETTDPGAIYNGAYVQYQPADFFAVKLGDLTFSEGAFVAYYDYDDPADNAAGMKEHDIRGFEIDLAGFILGFGFGRGDNDWADEEGAKVYDVHAAYEFDYAGQHLRPYVDYKSFQTTQHNELHAGVEAGLSLGGFGFRAVYGFHADYLGDDGDVVEGQDWTSTAHAFLVEPTFEVGMFDIKTTAFYAIIDRGDATEDASDLDNGEIPEYFFVYAEPAFKLAEFIKLGIPVEYHTHTLDDDDDTAATFDVGARVYITPVENLEITAFGMVDVAVQDNEDDNALRFGLETVYSF
ncbi:hypothetical protein [Fibrobacter sp. UWB5]|uniref:hypothetical protein n=1 Tax=Fibrobacter sp. UWB5 TaxID=1964360 RepID=UPI000B52109C|nr:hypothetical protein [Fibrobacter sp. UWB5]